MKKKIILLSIIIFPSLIYFFFELTQANFKKMPYFGPKTVDDKGDTVYWSVPQVYFLNNFKSYTDTTKDNEGNQIITKIWKADSLKIDTTNFPVYAILFINDDLKKDGYKLAGLYDYFKYKAKDLKDVSVITVSSVSSALDGFDFKDGIELRGAFDSLRISLPNFYPYLIDKNRKETTKLLSGTYFKGKPEYVYDYFMVLVDKKRHIRGYYDPSFNAEVKRMIDEYKHLKIRDEYAQTLKQNDIKQNEKK